VFFVVTFSILMAPVIKEHGLEVLPARYGDRLRTFFSKVSELATGSSTGNLAKVVRRLDFCSIPLRMSVEYLQIIGSFRATMSIPWPAVYTSIESRLSILDFNFLNMPSTACSTPQSELLSRMDGITISVVCILSYLGFFYGVVRLIMHLKEWEQERILAFNRVTISRITLVLILCYEPICEIVLNVFNCRAISDGVKTRYYLREDMQTECYVDIYSPHFKVAFFWVVVFIIGIPTFLLSLIYYYNVPRVAAELVSSARLRCLVDMAHRQRVPQPRVDVLELNIHNITPEHIDVLYRFFILCDKEELSHEESLVRAKECAELDDAERRRPTAITLPRFLRYLLHKANKVTFAFGMSTPNNSTRWKLDRILGYAADQLVPGVVTWHQARGDPRMGGAKDAIGPLFEETFPDKWYWVLIEQFQKLLITGCLMFIAPGRVAQAVAGLFMTLLFFVVYLFMQPFVEKAFRSVGFFLSFDLFVFFIFALMLKAGVHVMHNNMQFYSGCLGILTVGMFGFPIYVLIRRLRWPIEEEEEEEEEEGSAHGEKHGEKHGKHGEL
jgi:hypothetical protein